MRFRNVVRETQGCEYLVIQPKESFGSSPRMWFSVFALNNRVVCGFHVDAKTAVKSTSVYTTDVVCQLLDARAAPGLGIITYSYVNTELFPKFARLYGKAEIFNKIIQSLKPVCATWPVSSAH